MNRPTSQDTAAPIVVWQLSDGRRGHLSQSTGLINALGRHRSIEPHRLRVPPLRTTLYSWLTRCLDRAAGAPLPQVVIGAGHATHLHILALSRVCGAKSIVLMRPSLPLAWFDCCLIPAHDNPPGRDNIIVTRGAINALRPGNRHEPGRSLMLIGGHSAHYKFDAAAMLQVVRQALAGAPRRHWIVTDSPRTPASLSAELRKLAAAEVTVVAWQQCAPGWLAEQLSRAAEVWVTQDSVSMIYEALTAGCAVGLLPLKANRASRRVPRAVDELLRRGDVVSLAQWLAGVPLKALQQPLDEADRCARLLLERGLLAASGTCRR